MINFERTIPLLALVGLGFASTGCKAYSLGNAFEKVCDADCECPESSDYWDDEKNCKKACNGQAKATQADYADREAEPCDDIGDITKDLKKCADKSCGMSRNECVGTQLQKLFECWPPDSDDGDNAPPLDDERDLELEGDEVDWVPGMIPRTLEERTLYFADMASYECEHDHGDGASTPD